MYRRLPKPKSYFGERSTRCVSRGLDNLAVLSDDESDEDEPAKAEDVT